MASWTDSIPQFNPYVQQLPVEAMVEVGMEKQKRYEEGVTKIQSYIDNIASLDIAKDNHKQYLQSKLNALGNNLKIVAAGDFSNFQLVNSVGGMATQIVKDPIIQNAVSSTKMIRKGQQDMETAKKAGKSSVQNESWFNNGVSNWLSDNDLNTQFNGQYIEYTDVDKKLRDVADKIHAIDNSVDIPFQRDNAGNVLYFDEKGNVSTDPSKGVSKIDDAMLTIKMKGRPAEKILANFYDSLNENDMRQLHIDSWYHYKGTTKETLVADVQRNYSTQKQLLGDQIVNLNTELATNSKLTDAQKSAMTAKITDLKVKYNSGSLESETQQQISDINNIQNLDEYKYKVYTQTHLTNLAKDMSDMSYQYEYKNNPYFQAWKDREDLNYKYINMAREQRNWEMDYMLKLKTAEATAGIGTPITTPGRRSTDVEPPDLISLQKDIAEIQGVHGVPGKTEQVGQIDLLNSKYGGYLTGDDLKTPEQKQAYLDGIYKAYATDPSFMNSQTDPNMREYLKLRRGLDIELAQKQNLYDSVNTASKKFDDQIDATVKSGKRITDQYGKEMYSSKDLFEFDNDVNSNFYHAVPSTYYGGTVGGSVSSTSIELKGDDLINKYKGTKYEPLAIAYVKKSKTGWNSLTSAERLMLNTSDENKKSFGGTLSNVIKEKRKFQSDYLAARMPEYQTMIGSLSKESKGDMDRVAQLITRKAIEKEQGGVDVDKLSDFNLSTIDKLRENKNVGYSIEKHYDGTANLIITAGEDKQIVPMTASEFNSYFPQYARTNPITDIKYKVLQSSNKTTNTLGSAGQSKDAVNAYLTGESLPQLAGTAVASLVRVDIKGNPENDGHDKDRFVVYVYVNDNGNWIPRLVTPDYVNESTLNSVLTNSIGTATVEDILKQKK